MKIVLSDEDKQWFPVSLQEIEFRITSWKKETPMRRYSFLGHSYDAKEIDLDAPILLSLDLISVLPLRELKGER